MIKDSIKLQWDNLLRVISRIEIKEKDFDTKGFIQLCLLFQLFSYLTDEDCLTRKQKELIAYFVDMDDVNSAIINNEKGIIAAIKKIDVNCLFTLEILYKTEIEIKAQGTESKLSSDYIDFFLDLSWEFTEEMKNKPIDAIAQYKNEMIENVNKLAIETESSENETRRNNIVEKRMPAIEATDSTYYIVDNEKIDMDDIRAQYSFVMKVGIGDDNGLYKYEFIPVSYPSRPLWCNTGPEKRVFSADAVEKFTRIRVKEIRTDENGEKYAVLPVWYIEYWMDDNFQLIPDNASFKGSDCRVYNFRELPPNELLI